MRGTLLIGLVIVLLIIGLLVMKNMGVDGPGGIHKTQAEGYLEKAKNTADDVDKKFEDLKKRAQGID
jgi:hypothetical protein